MAGYYATQVADARATRTAAAPTMGKQEDGGATSRAAADQVFCTTIEGNLDDMSLAFSAIRTATLRAIPR